METAAAFNSKSLLQRQSSESGLGMPWSKRSLLPRQNFSRQSQNQILYQNLKDFLSTVFDIWSILTDIILDKIIENSTKGLKFDKIGLKLNRGKMNEIIRGSLVSLVILPTVFSTHQRLKRSVHLNRKTESFFVENTINSINI